MMHKRQQKSISVLRQRKWPHYIKQTKKNKERNYISAICSHNSPTLSCPVSSGARVTSTDICHVLDKTFPPVSGSYRSDDPGWVVLFRKWQVMVTMGDCFDQCIGDYNTTHLFWSRMIQNLVPCRKN